MEKYCDKCSFKAKHDKNPKSFVGRIWRWHINFCPGWKAYFNSLNDNEKQILRDRYKFNS